MSSNQSGPIGAVELQAAAAAAQPNDEEGSGEGIQVAGAHRALHEMVARGGSFSGRERNCAYLNTRDGNFAAAASAVGFDFADDTRSVVTLDYDQDGDLDVITTNRTAPRFRVLLNRSERLKDEDRNHAIQLILKGKHPGNRHALGATVELRMEGQPPIVRTAAAGSGFLGMSSQRFTIGIGQATRVDEVVVTWPGGQEESFGPMEADGSLPYLAEGGAKSELEFRPFPSRPSIASPASSTVTAIDGPGCDASVVSSFLALPEPLPPIERDGEAHAWRDLDLEPRALHEPGDGPRVVTLWSLDCGLCSLELADWKSSEATYPILALSVDEVIAAATESSFDSARLDDFAASWPENPNRTITFGMASFELLETLQAAIDRPFARDEDLALPATVVLDDEGRIASVHRGPVAEDVLERELAFLASPDAALAEKRRARVTPFEGQWLASAPTFSTVGLARAWVDSGRARAAADLLLRAEARGEWAPDSNATRPASRVAAEAARLLYEAGDLSHAIDAANFTSRLRPEWAKGHFNRATMLDAADRTEEAEAAYTLALQIRPRHWQALANRGWLRGNHGRKAEGLADLRKALSVLPRSAGATPRDQLARMIATLEAGSKER